jgi:hypothetical protein
LFWINILFVSHKFFPIFISNTGTRSYLTIDPLIFDLLVKTRKTFFPKKHFFSLFRLIFDCPLS